MNRILLGLSCTPEVGWSTIYKIFTQGIEKECLRWRESDWLLAYPFLTSVQAYHLEQTMQVEKLERYMERLAQQNISFISITDPYYPPMLKEIFDPPWIIFTKGDQSLLQIPSLSFVGSRKTTKYGAAVTVKLVSNLVREGWCIVSGMALGIDAISHRVTLQEEGKTIAVLGSGIDLPYPSQHRQLYEQISEKGLILSEYSPGTKPLPGFFPRRNRIISGLSYGTVVVEANKKSGSLITAHFALEQGREVFAVPGSIFDQQSSGTNLLIQQNGAKLTMDAEDILQEYTHIQINKAVNEEEERLNLDQNVDDIEKKLLEILALEKKHVQELCEELSLSFSEVSKYLLRLEMKRYIQPLPGSYYQRTN